MGVCAVATPVRDAVGAVGALTVEVPAVPLQRARRALASAVLRQRDLAHRALLGSPRRSPGLGPPLRPAGCPAALRASVSAPPRSASSCDHADS